MPRGNSGHLIQNSMITIDNSYFPVTINCIDPQGNTITLTVTEINGNGKIVFTTSDNITEDTNNSPLIALLLASVIGDTFEKVTIMINNDSQENSFLKENHITGKGGEA